MMMRKRKMTKWSVLAKTDALGLLEISHMMEMALECTFTSLAQYEFTAVSVLQDMQMELRRQMLNAAKSVHMACFHKSIKILDKKVVYQISSSVTVLPLSGHYSVEPSSGDHFQDKSCCEPVTQHKSSTSHSGRGRRHSPLGQKPPEGCWWCS